MGTKKSRAHPAKEARKAAKIEEGELRAMLGAFGEPVPYEVEGKLVRYRCRTQWERKTLMANKFRQEGADRMVLVSDREGAEYVARTVAQGGIG